METKYYNRYSFQELEEKATAPEAEQIDVDTLGAWFEYYGMNYWNGICFCVRAGLDLYPIYSFDSEFDVYNVVGYEFR